MEHPHCIQALGESSVTRWKGCDVSALSPRDQQAFAAVVNEFGRLSAAAQGLRVPITDYSKLASGDQELYLAARRLCGQRVLVLGGLKVGRKRLWVWPPGEAAPKEVAALCVLDFFVHETVQRTGVGKQLFEAFLAAEGVAADVLAYDLPSPKCKAFLRKHYGLEEPVILSNNYLVFPTFFQKALRSQAPPLCQPHLASASARPLSSAARRRLGLGPVHSGSPRSQHGSPRSLTQQRMHFGTLRTAQQRAQRGLAAEALGLATQSGVLRGGCLAGDANGGSSNGGSSNGGSSNGGSCKLWESGGRHVGSGSWCEGSSGKSAMAAAAPGAAVPAAESRGERCPGGLLQCDVSAAPSLECSGAPAKGCSSLSRRQQQQQQQLSDGRCYLPAVASGGNGGRCGTGAAASPLSPLQPAIRSHIQLSSIGREQRAGVGAGACLQW